MTKTYYVLQANSEFWETNYQQEVFGIFDNLDALRRHAMTLVQGAVSILDFNTSTLDELSSGQYDCHLTFGEYDTGLAIVAGPLNGNADEYHQISIVTAKIAPKIASIDLNLDSAKHPAESDDDCTDYSQPPF